MAESNSNTAQLRHTGSGLSDEGSLNFEDAEDDDNFLSPTAPQPGAFMSPDAAADSAELEMGRDDIPQDHSEEGGAAVTEQATAAEDEGAVGAAASSEPEATQREQPGDPEKEAERVALSSPGAPHDEGGEGVRQEDAQEVLAEQEQEEREATEQALVARPLWAAMWLGQTSLRSHHTVRSRRPLPSPKLLREASYLSRTSRRGNW